MADFACARPFVYRAADGINYEFGAGTIYPDMSDEFVADWHVQHHSEASVRARGGALVAYRRLMMMDTVNGGYVQTDRWATVLLQPNVNPEYLQVLELGARPLFKSDVDSFGDLERPPPETGDGTISADSLGFGAYRMWGAQHSRGYNVPTIKVYPGDGVSPPVNRGAPPVDRSGEQINDPRTVGAFPPLYPALTASPEPVMNPWPQQRFSGTQATPTPAAWPQDQYTWRDPRG